MFIQPLKDESSAITHWVSFHRDAGARLRQTGDRPAAGLPGWLREDRLTGLNSREYFDEFLQRDWAVAQREALEIGMVLLDIDALGAYNETFDKTAGDACIRRVSRVISGSYRRGGDLIGRWEGGTFVVLIQADSTVKAAEYARIVAQRVNDLLIHHPRGAKMRYVTLSGGVACIVPTRNMDVSALSNAARAALKRAKTRHNTVELAQPGDYK
jgi:diguanylate cyclase (GGDEF)-like protein